MLPFAGASHFAVSQFLTSQFLWLSLSQGEHRKPLEITQGAGLHLCLRAASAPGVKGRCVAKIASLVGKTSPWQP